MQMIFQITKFLNNLISEILMDMILQVILETKVDVDHAIPSLLLK